jgi:transcriptional regulator NrdR family protein
MKCPDCGCHRVEVVITTYSTDEQIVRRRHCFACDARWYTLQSPEVLLDKKDFTWIERAGRRKAVKLHTNETLA